MAYLTMPIDRQELLIKRSSQMTLYLEKYANFNSKEEMDNVSNQHITANWNQLNQTDRSVLDMIRRYSVKYGAAHLKHETIANSVKKSVSTIRRSIVKLEKLEIIERVKFIRKVLNGLGANIYSILPFKTQNEQSEMNSREVSTKVDTPTSKLSKIENEPLSFKSLYKHPSRCDTCHAEPSITLFERFKSLINTSIGNSDSTLPSRLYGVYRSQSIKLMRFSIHADKGDLLQDLSIQALNITIQATKKKTMRNTAGYYSGVLNKLIDKSLFADAFLDYDEDIELCIY